MIKLFVVFLTYTDGNKEFYNIYPNMVNAIEEAEKAIRKDEEVENAFLCYDLISTEGRKTIKTYTIK